MKEKAIDKKSPEPKEPRRLFYPIIYTIFLVIIYFLIFSIGKTVLSGWLEIILFLASIIASIYIAKHTKDKCCNTLAIISFLYGILNVVQIIVALPMYLILRDQINMPVWTTVYQAIVYATSLGIIILTGKKFVPAWKTDREKVGLKELPTFTDIGLGIVGIIATLILSGIISSVLTNFPWFNASQTQNVGFDYLNAGLDRIVAFIALVIVAPVFEEIIFRGWLYDKLRGKYSFIPSMIITSALFGFMHGQWNVGVTVGLMSAVMCFERETTGTIYAGIITHMLKNGIAFYLLYIM